MGSEQANLVINSYMGSSKKKKPGFRILVVHGPNLNLLGERETDIYGRGTLAELNTSLRKLGRQMNVTLKFFQSNSEGSLIDFLHENRMWADGLVINPGAYTHYSYAIRDAISGISILTVEVHLSDIHAREKFRKRSVIQPVCLAQFSGDGFQSYFDGLQYLVKTLDQK